MKREHSNESGSIMRSQDKKLYGGLQEYSEQPRPRIQEDLTDPRRTHHNFNAQNKDIKSGFQPRETSPTEYQIGFQNEYQPNTQFTGVKSDKSSQGGMSVPDEKVEYATVLEVNQYLDEDLGPS